MHIITPIHHPPQNPYMVSLFPIKPLTGSAPGVTYSWIKFQMKCVLALCALVAATVAFPDGAPESTCGDMLPQHGQPGQNSPSPYTLKLSKSAIKAGETIYGNNMLVSI